MPVAASLYPRPQLWSGVLSSSSLLFLQVWHGNGSLLLLQITQGVLHHPSVLYPDLFNSPRNSSLLPHRMNHLFPTGTQAHTLGKQFTLPYTPPVREKDKRYMYPFHQQ